MAGAVSVICFKMHRRFCAVQVSCAFAGVDVKMPKGKKTSKISMFLWYIEVCLVPGRLAGRCSFSYIY